MSITASTQAFAMWDVLYNAIKNEAHTGGRLATLVDVAKSAELNRGALGPCAAVQLTGWEKVDNYSPRQHIIRVGFKVLLAAASVDAPGRSAVLDDAMAALSPLVDDGGSNGLIPLLNSPSLFGLGGLAMESQLGVSAFDWDLRAGPGQSKWAYFLQEYSANTIATF